MSEQTDETDVLADRVAALVDAYAEEPHSDGCGIDACVRCVVDEFANLLTPTGQSAEDGAR